LKRVFLKVTAALLLVLLWGCQESVEYCPDKNPYLYCSFQNTEKISFDTFTVIIDGLSEIQIAQNGNNTTKSDTIFNGSTPPDTLLIPLSANSNNVTFRCMFGSNKGDICKIYYNSDILFANPECGFIAMYSIDSFLLSTNIFDSAYIKFPYINDDQQKNIEIFY